MTTCTRRQIPVRCQPSPDPRLNQTVCMWCRKPLPTEPGPVLRDPVFERDAIVEAGRLVGIDANDLADYARKRADVGGPTIRPMDHYLEAAQELGDLANYLSWKLRGVIDVGSPSVVVYQEALGYAAVAFDRLNRARDLEAGV